MMFEQIDSLFSAYTISFKKYNSFISHHFAERRYSVQVGENQKAEDLCIKSCHSWFKTNLIETKIYIKDGFVTFLKLIGEVKSNYRSQVK